MRSTTKGPDKRRLGFAYILLSAALWGTLPIFSTLSYRLGSDALTSAAMRSYLSCAAFIVWFVAEKRFLKIKPRQLPFYICYGLLAGGGTFLCYMSAIEHLSTAMASVLLYTAPAFVILFNRLLYRERITFIKLLAVLCTLAGCFLVVRAYNFSSFENNLKWILVGLASGICYSMTTVMGKKAKLLNDGKTNAGMMIMLGSLVFFMAKPPWTIRVARPEIWLCYIGLAAFGTVMAYTMYLKGLDNVPDGGTASIIATLEPIIGTSLGVAVLGDRMEAPQIIGIAIVVIGICLPIILESREEGEPNPPLAADSRGGLGHSQQRGVCVNDRKARKIHQG